MEYLLTGCCSLFFAWTAYLFFSAAYKAIYLKWWGVATTGTIVELIRDEGKGPEDGITYTPVVAFSTKGGVQVQSQSAVGLYEAGSYFRVGEQVAIRYSAKSPAEFTIDGYEVAGLAWLFIIAAVAFAVLWLSIKDLHR